ncbi:MAG: PEP-CTERM system TPR-repeat protein PrsT [Gammaproteobacteria bacterium]|nr:PEP-CTERM system TPR-repeat protein PrsT [Gammaproteobacteria bacterium]
MKKFKKIIVISLVVSGIIFSSSITANNYIEDAQQYFDKGEYKSAIIQLKNQLKKNPGDANARYLLGITYLKTGDIKQAEKEINRAYKLTPDNDEVKLSYAQLLLLQKKYKKIHEVLKNKLTTSDNENKRQLYQAYAYLGENQLADAKQIFSELSNSQKSAPVFIGLAKIAFLEKENKKAGQWLEQALQTEPDNIIALQTKVILLLADKNYKEALSIYNKIITLQPDNLTFYLKRASIYFRLKEFNNAEKDVMSVLKQRKNNPTANYLLAQIKLQEKKYKESQVAAQNVLNVLPRHYNSMLLLGFANYGLGNYNQADKFLTQYLSSNPDNIAVQNLLANVYLAQKNGEQALLILENIDEEKKNHNANVLMTLGSAYFLTGEHQKGVDALNKAKKLEPDSKIIQSKLVAGQLKTGDVESAISGLEQIVNLEQANNKTKYLLIISYIQTKELKKAEDKLKDLIQQTPKDPALYNLTAVVEKLKGNNQKAVNAFNDAIKLNDKYIPAYIGLAELSVLQKDWALAKKYYSKVIQVNPKYIKAYLFLAGIAEKENNKIEIEKQLKIGFEQSKGNINSQLILVKYLSKWYIKQKTPEKIMPIAEVLVKQHPRNNSVLSFQAFAQIANKKIEQAERTLTTIINNNPSDVKHRLLLADILLKKKGNEEKILELLDSVINIVPNNPKPLKLKATYLLKLKKYSQVLEVADYTEKQFPKLALGHQLKGDIYRLQKKFDQAIINYQAAYKIQPDTKGLVVISELLKKQGKETEAIKLLKAQLKGDDDDLAIHFQIASIYQQSQQYTMADKHYSKMLAIKSDNILALNNLALIYAEENNPKALKLAKKAYEQAPNSAAIMDTYGSIQVKQGSIMEGIKLLENAVKTSPKDYNIKYHLAEAYYLNKENIKAKKLLESIVDDNVNFSDKENAKKLLNQLQ